MRSAKFCEAVLSVPDKASPSASVTAEAELRSVLSQWPVAAVQPCLQNLRFKSRRWLSSGWDDCGWRESPRVACSHCRTCCTPFLFDSR